MLLYTGYLTIRAYKVREDSVTLELPNQEVSRAFSEQLLPVMTKREIIAFSGVKNALIRMFDNNQLEGLQEVLNTTLAQINYHMISDKESYYQTVFYFLFNMCGLPTSAEDLTNRGRADLTMQTKDFIYIIELKMNQPANVALQQIKDRGYAEKYALDGRQVVLIGIEIQADGHCVQSLAVEN